MPDQLAAALPESRFVEFQRFAARRMLPQRRIELYLAQIAMQVALGRGLKDLALSDFLFDPIDDDVPSADEARAFFKFSPKA